MFVCQAYMYVKACMSRIFEHKIRQQIEIDDMQFGFIKGKGTTVHLFYGKIDAGEF